MTVSLLTLRIGWALMRTPANSAKPPSNPAIQQAEEDGAHL